MYMTGFCHFLTFQWRAVFRFSNFGFPEKFVRKVTELVDDHIEYYPGKVRSVYLTKE